MPGIHETGADRGGEAFPLLSGSSVLRRAVHQEDRRRREEKAAGVDRECRPGSNQANQHAGHRRADDQAQLLRPLHQGIGRLQAPTVNEHRHDPPQGGIEEGIDQAEEERQEVEIPERDGV